MRFTLPVFAFLSLVTLVCGCAGRIHVVEDARTGGTVALHGPEEKAREKADAHMKARCPAGYEIVEQGEAATEDGSREWRITYACKGQNQIGAQLGRIAF